MAMLKRSYGKGHNSIVYEHTYGKHSGLSFSVERAMHLYSTLTLVKSTHYCHLSALCVVIQKHPKWIPSSRKTMMLFSTFSKSDISSLSKQRGKNTHKTL